MNSEMIMKLVDEYAWRAHVDSDKGLTEKARNEVIVVIEQLTKDAARYRFIRVGDPDNAVMTWVDGLDDWTPWASPEDVEQAIDAAIAAQKGEQV